MSFNNPQQITKNTKFFVPVEKNSCFLLFFWIPCGNLRSLDFIKKQQFYIVKLKIYVVVIENDKKYVLLNWQQI